MVKLIEKAVECLPKGRIRVNSDSGLKTRNREEPRAALANTVGATLELRRAYTDAKA